MSQATNFKAIMERNPDSRATATDIIVLLVQDSISHVEHNIKSTYWTSPADADIFTQSLTPEVERYRHLVDCIEEIISDLPTQPSFNGLNLFDDVETVIQWLNECPETVSLVDQTMRHTKSTICTYLNLIKGLLDRISKMEVSEDNEKEVAILFISVLRAAAKNFDNTRGYKIDWDWGVFSNKTFIQSARAKVSKRTHGVANPDEERDQSQASTQITPQNTSQTREAEMLSLIYQPKSGQSQTSSQGDQSLPSISIFLPPSPVQREREIEVIPLSPEPIQEPEQPSVSTALPPEIFQSNDEEEEQPITASSDSVQSEVETLCLESTSREGDPGETTQASSTQHQGNNPPLPGIGSFLQLDSLQQRFDEEEQQVTLSSDSIQQQNEPQVSVSANESPTSLSEPGVDELPFQDEDLGPIDCETELQ